DQRVDVLLKLLQARFGRTGTARAFERERLGAHADGEYALVARGLGDDRSSARTGPAAHAGGDEAHVRAVERGNDLVDRLFGGRAADLGPRASAEALGDLQTKLDPAIGER